MKKDNPCHNCTDRQAGCHARCERYQSWQAEHIEQKRKEKDDKAKRDIAIGFAIDSVRRSKKVRHK